MRVERLFNIGLALATFVLLFPGAYGPIHTGLDGSWVYAINAAAARGLIWGRDLVFTYGPLGYLIQPVEIGNNLEKGLLFQTAIHAIFGFLLIYLAVQKRFKVNFIPFCIAYSFSMFSWLRFEYHILILLCLLLYVSFEASALSQSSAAVASVLAAMLIFIKFNLGIAAIGAVIVFAVLAFFSAHPRRIGLAWTAVVALSAGLALYSMILFRSFRNFSRWLDASLELLSGYSVAMSYVGPPAALNIALVLIFVLAVYVALLVIHRQPHRYFFYISFCLTFIAFKHGFVRGDAHVVMFFSYALALLSVAILLARSRRELTALAVFFILTSAITVFIGSRFGYAVRSDYYEAFTGMRAMTRISNALNPARLKKRLAEASKANLRPDVLPSTMADRIKSSDLTVDVAPWEISYVAANGFKWSPNPLLQFYSIYTPLLDRWSSEHYIAEGAPEIILLSYAAIDKKHMLWDTPQSWRAIYSNYEHLDFIRDKRIVVLRRRERPGTAALNSTGSLIVDRHDWVDVPISDNILFAKCRMNLRPHGVMLKALFRVPPVYVSVVFDDRSRRRFRIIPEQAGEGLQMNYLPVNATQLSRLFQGEYVRRVAKFRFCGPGLKFYPKELGIEWQEMPYPFIPDKNVR
jgi:hypothetical protein